MVDEKHLTEFQGPSLVDPRRVHLSHTFRWFRSVKWYRLAIKAMWIELVHRFYWSTSTLALHMPEFYLYVFVLLHAALVWFLILCRWNFAPRSGTMKLYPIVFRAAEWNGSRFHPAGPFAHHLGQSIRAALWFYLIIGATHWLGRQIWLEIIV